MKEQYGHGIIWYQMAEVMYHLVIMSSQHPITPAGVTPPSQAPSNNESHIHSWALIHIASSVWGSLTVAPNYFYLLKGHSTNSAPRQANVPKLIQSRLAILSKRKTQEIIRPLILSASSACARFSRLRPSKQFHSSDSSPPVVASLSCRLKLRLSQTRNWHYPATTQELTLKSSKAPHAQPTKSVTVFGWHSTGISVCFDLIGLVSPTVQHSVGGSRRWTGLLRSWHRNFHASNGDKIQESPKRQ